jgi:hypothetical protein
MPRIKKKNIKKSVFLRPMLEAGKHLTKNHLAKIRCFMDDPAYTRLDIALAVGVSVKQVSYSINKIKKENDGKEPI